MLTRPCAICLLFAAQIFQSVTFSQVAVCDDLSATIAAWQKRQSESTGVLVEWEEHHKEIDTYWVRNHARDPVFIELIKTAGIEAYLAKAPQLTYQQNKHLLITDACYRYTFKGPRVIDGVKQPQELDVSFDGKTTIHYSAAYKQGGHPSANVYTEPKAMVRNINYLPIILYSRPFDSRLGGITVESLSFVSNDESINGRKLVVIESKEPGVTRSLRLWVDPTMEYAPVRIRELRDKEQAFQIDIEYGMEGANRPTGWKIAKGGDSLIDKSTAAASVKAWDTSKELPIERFQVRFPVGTTVAEFSDKGERQYVVREDEESP